MGDERFTIDNFYKGNPTIHDNDTDCFYGVMDSFENVQLFIKRLNHLNKSYELVKNHNRNLEHFNRCLIRIMANEGIKLDKYFDLPKKHYEDEK